MRQRRRAVRQGQQPLWVWNEVQLGDGFRPQNFPFQGVGTVNARLPQNPTPLDYFNLYFTNRIIDHILTETNRYADQYIRQQGDNMRPHSLVHQWVATDRDEKRAFLGLMVLMGVVYKPRLTMYWSNDELYQKPIFQSILPRDRFLLLLRFLHFADNTNYDANDPNRDRLYKIRQMTEMINDRCAAVYYPCENLTVDESLVLFKGRLLFKQYINTKRTRFSIKLYELCTYPGANSFFLELCKMLFAGFLVPKFALVWGMVVRGFAHRDLC